MLRGISSPVVHGKTRRNEVTQQDFDMGYVLKVPFDKRSSHTYSAPGFTAAAYLDILAEENQSQSLSAPTPLLPSHA